VAEREIVLLNDVAKTSKYFGICVIFLSLFLILAGCRENIANENAALFGNIFYVGDVDFSGDSTGAVNTLNWMFLRFHHDDVIERVDMIYDMRSPLGSPRFDFIKHYGVFELDGRILTITFSGESPIIGIVQNDGESIAISSIGRGVFEHFDEYAQANYENSDAVLAKFN
jgi:hypothetical protein